VQPDLIRAGGWHTSGRLSPLGEEKKKSTNPKVFELERKFHFNQED
jgi:hypothetical protein